MENNSTYGATFIEALDGRRIRSQHEIIMDYMLKNDYVSLNNIASETGFNTASVSAQLRHLRKAKFGGYIVEKRRVSINNAGTWEYKVINPDPNKQETLF